MQTSLNKGKNTYVAGKSWRKSVQKSRNIKNKCTTHTEIVKEKIKREDILKIYLLFDDNKIYFTIIFDA